LQHVSCAVGGVDPREPEAQGIVGVDG